MDIRSKIGEGFAPLIDLVYPPRCPLCGEAIGRHGGLCTACWSGLAVPSPPACRTCDRPFDNAILGDDLLCAPCLASPPKHAGISAGTLYNDASRKLILSFKHGGKLGLAPMLARLIAARLPEQGEGNRLPLLVPVPLHRWRLWSRGFDQAAVLARELEHLGKGSLVVDLLERHKQTPSLGGLGKKARARALKGAIRVSSSRNVILKGRDVILVDDVLTSGSTSDACVSALLTGGASSVRIACFARVLDNVEHRTQGAQNETPEA